MAMVENKYDFRFFIFFAITAFIVLFLGINFEFIGKLLMLYGALFGTHELLKYLGIARYMLSSKTEREARKFMKQKEKRMKKQRKSYEK